MNPAQRASAIQQTSHQAYPVVDEELWIFAKRTIKTEAHNCWQNFGPFPQTKTPITKRSIEEYAQKMGIFVAPVAPMAPMAPIVPAGTETNAAELALNRPREDEDYELFEQGGKIKSRCLICKKNEHRAKYTTRWKALSSRPDHIREHYLAHMGRKFRCEVNNCHTLFKHHKDLRKHIKDECIHTKADVESLSPRNRYSFFYPPTGDVAIDSQLHDTE